MILDLAVIRIPEKVQVPCKEKVIVQFTGRTRRDLKKTLKLPIAASHIPPQCLHRLKNCNVAFDLKAHRALLSETARWLHKSLGSNCVLLPRLSSSGNPSWLPPFCEGQMLCAKCQMLCDGYHIPRYALPTLTFRNLAGAAPWPVPITCCGCPLPQLGVPHSVHSSREQIASIEFQKSVVIPEYDGFFSVRTRLPFLISQPIS